MLSINFFQLRRLGLRQFNNFHKGILQAVGICALGTAKLPSASFLFGTVPPLRRRALYVQIQI